MLSMSSVTSIRFLPGFNLLDVDFRSSRKSLDYTKQSLRISIDLGKREEESETWLQVGRIYHLIREDELADMYLQVREGLELHGTSSNKFLGLNGCF